MLEQNDDTGYYKLVNYTGSSIGTNVQIENDVALEVIETAKPHIKKEEIKRD